MLSQFTVKNFKSIRDEMTFDMQAVSISEHEDKIIKGRNNDSFLPVSVLYGPNGGGKSNVLEAMETLHGLVMKPLKVTDSFDGIHYKIMKNTAVPFIFSDDTKNAPTEFELFFCTHIAEYKYVLHVKGNDIIYESLDRIKFETNRKSSLFIRRTEKIILKQEFKNFKISDDLSSSLPLLSYLGIMYKKNAIIADVLSWFEENICFLNYGDPIQEMKTAVFKSEKIKMLILDMIKEMDLDIEDYRIENVDENRIKIYTMHDISGQKIELTMAEESSGTQKIFGLLPFIARSLIMGTTLVIDELDAKVHPLLLKHMIMMYTDMNSNQKGAQLIFTSHDLTTMTNEIFRRDEIWFVAKGNKQNSKLYSLVEFKDVQGKSVRKDARFDKQYLEGKYGADPYLKRIVNWSKEYD